MFSHGADGLSLMCHISQAADSAGMMLCTTHSSSKSSADFAILYGNSATM